MIPRLITRGSYDFLVWPPRPDGKQFVWELGPSTRDARKLGSTHSSIDDLTKGAKDGPQT